MAISGTMRHMTNHTNLAQNEQATIDSIAEILRVDLKLGPDVEINADTPLLGGDYDLDSLDILLLVTSIEKRFGIKIANEDVGREAFATVGTLAQFVEKTRSASGSSES
jgi:acyl carrier protein